MGCSLCVPKKRKAVGSYVGSDDANPFETLTKKDRICLRETYQRLSDPKEVLGAIFVDFVCEVAPELKQMFGVERTPKAGMVKMPQLGGHVARMADLFEQLTNLLGYTENLLGAWQLVRKTGRMHTRLAILQINQTSTNNESRDYFNLISDYFELHFVPYLTNEKEEADSDVKKVRFASTYSAATISDVWHRFFHILSTQLTETFEQEKHKQANALSRKTLAPHQQTEQNERNKKKIQERQSEIENNANACEVKKAEELLEDPF
ncbi:hypothetical protein AB6A40_001473 [Gnathostoma spinigerum]|uniref:Neuroglobin n=1 Tax=Gnathostoma spinigerum TaxID=75299 RepID=A0ABD6EBN7_9BILA